MCGIAGIWSGSASAGDRTAQVGEMLARIRHRGPDGESVVRTGAAVLGACRLAVMDPERGAQPMTTSDGRYTLAFNGEVVNHIELRAELEAAGAAFRTTCDTEVLLELLAREGEAGLARVNGMFAGAFADARDGTVLLFRDPCGIKPLYWTEHEGAVVFASEPKALPAVTGTPRANPDAVLEYLAFQVPLGTSTFFAGVRRLAPGTMLRLRPGETPAIAPLPAWHGTPDVPDDPAAAAEALAALLEDAVRIHLRSDVPLGTHLSGGVDSSLVASLAASALAGPVHVFTGAFDVPGFDEREHARAVAAEIGATAHEVVPGPEALAEALPLAIAAMDEPAAGPGLLAQWFVAREAAAHVKVVLGGQGGDELFGGYVRHLVLRLELALRAALEGGETAPLRELAPHLASLDGYAPLLKRSFARGLEGSVAGRYFGLIHRGAGLDRYLTGDLRAGLQGYDARGRFLVRFEEAAGGADLDDAFGLGAAAAAARFDRRVLLPALLHVEDRTSMAVSLESRVPLLDRRLLAFLDACPDRVLFADAGLKALLRRAAGDRLPRAARARRDKMGFPVPLAAWARGPLRSYFLDLLTDKTARERGVYDVAAVEGLLDAETVDARSLWALVNLELWHRTVAP